MPNLEDEVKDIAAMRDLDALRRKRSGRKSQFTRLLQVLNSASSDLAGKLSERDCAKRVAEARRMAALLEAIQDRIEELTADKEDELQSEIAIGLPLREDHDQLVNKAERLEEREGVYRTGAWLVSLCTRLLAREKPALSTLLTERDKVFSKMEDFQKSTGLFQTDAMIQDQVTQMDHLMSKLDYKIDELTAADAETTKATEPETRPRTTCGHSSKLKLDLPSYEGDPVQWASFKSLFTSAMDRAGEEVTDHEKTIHLLSCVQPNEAKIIVKQFSNLKDCYKPAIEALEERYGSRNKVYSLHVKTFLKDETYHYTSKSLYQMAVTYKNFLQGAKGCEGDSFEHLVAGVLLTRFDKTLANEWRHHWEEDSKLPTIDDILKFVKRWSSRLETQPSSSDHPTSANKSQTPQHKQSQQRDRQRRSIVATVSTAPKIKNTTTDPKCAACQGPRHSLSRCQTFLDMAPDKRRDLVASNNMCLNCLYPGHHSNDCRSKGTCRVCRSSQHHTLLHQSNTSAPTPPTPPSPKPNDGNVMVTYGTKPGDDILLATAKVVIRQGSQNITSRVLMDSGSVPSLITKKLADRLSTDRTQCTATFTHAGGELITSRHKVDLTLHGDCKFRIPREPVNVSCHIVDSLPATVSPQDTNIILDHPIVRGKTPIADMEMGGDVDILLGMADSLRCQTGTREKSEDGAACVFGTSFGWVLGGRFPGSPTNQTVLTLQQVQRDIDSDLQRLWEMDRVPTTDNLLTEEETRAVEHFQDTHSRDKQDGRFIVKLPRKEMPPPLGESQQTAIKRFLRNEKALKNRNQWDNFDEVLKEYIDLGHAEIVPEVELEKPHYYLPVHGVIKESSSTTRLRAVFDASCKTSTGHSLNDQLLSGPNLYPLLSTVINKFRLPQIAVTADISKMFREIALHPDERDYHRFLFRTDNGCLVSARMRRLTFGVTSSPYLATQTLHKLAEECRQQYPLASHTIRHLFYVDDCLAGADTLDQAKELVNELIPALRSIGMTLRKFRSNSEELMEFIPETLREKEDLTIQDPKSAGRTLGIHWKVRNDTFHITSPTPPSSEVNATKRVIASTAAQVYDILGLWAPVTVIARMLLQELWRRELDWDATVPEEVERKWREWKAELPLLTEHPIPRRLLTSSCTYSLQLHGFSDASTKAYGAVIYLRAVYSDSSTSVMLVTAKSRVTPVKSETIPRLELTAALMLARLVKATASDLDISLDNCYAWTDSSIVLSWLHHSPATLKTYQANRVAAILDILRRSQWRHVRGPDNPADLPSRGMLPTKLIKTPLWWFGPPWLTSSPEHWPHTRLTFKESGEGFKPMTVTTVTPPKTAPWKFWEEISDFDRLVRIITYCRRFIAACRRQTEVKTTTTSLNSDEITATRNHLLHISQRETYMEVFEWLKMRRTIPRHHLLSKFDVSIDKDTNLLVVSGRVRKIDALTSRHQVVLSLKSHITVLFVNTRHRTWHHPGVTTMLSLLTDNYYIPRVRNFLKLLSRKCVHCQKAYALPTSQRMGNLPTSRTTPAPPFKRMGVDFAGPFLITRGNPRKPTRVKAYAAVFICLTTRAVHFEVCSDLSTDSFLACLRRFIGRRGCPAHVYSDNGTNFLGAKNELEEISTMMTSPGTKDAINNITTSHHIQWHFTPPRTPHFGGLWEAGVKSMKTLLRKNLASRPLSYDELETVLIEAEATLNSRPLDSNISTEPDSPELLTPGHFLIGRPLLSLPPTSVDNSGRPQLLKRWAYIRHLTTDLWKKWKSTYMQAINARSKWTSHRRNFQVGDIVLLKDEMIRERTWPLAKVLHTHPGEDNLVRVVDLLCNGRVYRRATNRLVLLVEAPPLSPSRPAEDVRASPEVSCESQPQNSTSINT